MGWPTQTHKHDVGDDQSKHVVIDRCSNSNTNADFDWRQIFNPAEMRFSNQIVNKTQQPKNICILAVLRVTYYATTYGGT